MAELSRAAWVEIDLDAIAHNVRMTRDLIGAGVKLFACVKADAFGLGLVPVSRMVARAGVDGLTVSDASEAAALRAAGISLPILLYAGVLPEQAAAVAALDGVIATVHDMHSLAAFAAAGRPVTVFLKIGCRGGRYGFTMETLGAALEAARRAPALRVKGLYTNLSSPEDRAFTTAQAEEFKRARAEAVRCGFTDLEMLAASSRILLGYPEMRHTAVDPGRLLLGFLAEPWAGMAPMRPALHAVKSRVAQIQHYRVGSVVEGVQASGEPLRLEKDLRVAVLPIGYADGFRSNGPFAEVLICGHRAPVLGPLGVESMVIDVSAVPQAEVGTEAVLLGQQGSQRITLSELAAALALPMSELFFRLTRNARKVYSGEGGRMASDESTRSANGLCASSS